MAQFYAAIQGNRGEATRIGTASSGIEGHIRGWNCGVYVEGQTVDFDSFDVTATLGSDATRGGMGARSGVDLVTVCRSEDLEEFEITLANNPTMRAAARELLAAKEPTQ